jgi:hemerythrin
VGVATLDKQHRVIISVINELHEASQASVRSEIISGTLGRLTQFASQHFAAEELLLAEHGYPDLDDQKREHREYRLKVVALCQDTVDLQESVPRDLLAFLHDWWITHILESDKKFEAFLAARGVS